MNIWLSLLFLFLGWLLGLFGPIIVDEIRRRRKATQIKSSIIIELTELRFKLAFTVYKMAFSFGTWDRPLLEWIKTIVHGYKGTHTDERIEESIDKLLSRSDEDLAVGDMYGKAISLGAVALKKYNIPLLDANIGALVVLPSDFQNLLIEIKTQIGILNEQVDEAKFFYKKTFDSGISKENYKILQHNIRNTYLQVCQRAKDVADLVTKCLNRVENNEASKRSKHDKRSSS